MSTDLTQFLNERRRRQKELYTNGSMISPTGNFYVEEPDMKRFWLLYCNGLKKREVYGLTEKPLDTGPLRIDFDFKFDSKVGLKRVYTDEHVKEVIHVYQNIISGLVESTEYNEKMLYCILLQKKTRIEDGYVKDGFHLHFPNFICNEYLQDHYIRNKMISAIEKFKEFESFREDVIARIVDSTKLDSKLTLFEKISKVVDPVFKKNWLLYGSVKRQGLEPFKVMQYFDESVNSITIDQMFETQLRSLEEARGKKVNAEFYLPQFLSIRNGEEATPLEEKVTQVYQQHQQMRRERKKLNVKQTRSETEILEDLKKIDDGKIMDMLNDYRADNHDERMNVGWTLFNISQGHEKGLEMWIDFCKRCPRFREGVCEERWEKMEIRGKSIASLLFMAKYDNPDAYNAWRKLQIDHLFYEAVKFPKPTHVAVARIVHRMYEHDFVCADVDHDRWFQYHNHRWHDIKCGSAIQKLLTKDVALEFQNFAMALGRKAFATDNPDERDNIIKQRDRAYKIITELHQEPFTRSVLKMCKLEFGDPNFFAKMNENRDLLGFANGVYDLKQGMFRPGSPDDYITFSTHTNFPVQGFSYQDEEIIDLNEYLEKVFVNVKLRNYFLDFTSSCLQGGNRNKIFAVFTGEGDAGKTVVVKVIEKVFGDYFLNFPRETFVMGGRPTAGGARPDLARVKGKRIAFAKEIAKNENLNIGTLKEMTGNDSFFARGLYKDGEDVSPQMTICIMVNTPPKIPAHDEATWNRIRVLTFESCFPKPNDPKRPIPDNLEDQKRCKTFPQDPNLAEKIDQYVVPLTWLLLQRFKTYLKEGIHEPEEVLFASQRYKTDNDIYQQFVEEKLDRTTDVKKWISGTELYGAFKAWYTTNYPSYANREKIGLAQYKNEMSKRLGIHCERNRWVGIQFKLEEPDADEEQGDGLPSVVPSKGKEEIEYVEAANFQIDE